MKELGVEEKAKAYDEAIAKGKQIQNTPYTAHWDIMKEVAEHLLPELKESEDEKMKKAIHIYLDWLDGRKDYAPKGEYSISDMIAWLDKQGETSPVLSNSSNIRKDARNEEEQNRFAKSVPAYYIPEGFHAVIEGNKVVIKQGEQKHTDKVEPKFKVGDKIQYLKGFGTIMTIVKIENGEYIFADNMGHTTIEKGNTWYLVNPVKQKTAWSEEDREMSRFIGNAITADGASIYLESKGIQVIDAHVWLEKLKDRVQTKQEWSKEDEDAIAEAIMALESMYDPDKPERHYAGYTLTFDKAAEKLKSLKPQKQWKPTKEQMNALQKEVNKHWDVDGDSLWSLYEELKKL